MAQSTQTPATHVVKQGEHIASIADVYGFSSWETVWDDDGNAELRKRRPNPNTLLPGDKVEIPERKEKEESCATEKRHRFKCECPPLQLRVKFLDVGGASITDGKAKLTLGGEAITLTTDSEGMIERRIPASAQSSPLKLESKQLWEPLETTLAIGELDPIDTRTGQIARLNNLGYNAGPVQAPTSPDDEERFKSAVEEFQCEEKIKPTDGKCQGQTLEKLKTVHGC
jgi:hypothetical protein